MSRLWSLRSSADEADPNDGGDRAERIAGALTGDDQAMMLTTVPAHPQRPPLPDDPAQPPAPGWVWRGKDPPGGIKGAWYNPSTKESLHPDLQHPPPIGPYWDYKDASGTRWRVFLDGRMEPEK